MSAWEALLAAGAGAGALAAIGAVLAWLLAPRMTQYLATLAQHARENAAQLQPGGELHRKVSTAAGAATELPQLRAEIERMAKEGSQLAQETAARVTVLETWRPVIERRQGVTEQALLALLGPELIHRLRDDLRERDT